MGRTTEERAAQAVSEVREQIDAELDMYLLNAEPATSAADAAADVAARLFRVYNVRAEED